MIIENADAISIGVGALSVLWFVADVIKVLKKARITTITKDNLRVLMINFVVALLAYSAAIFLLANYNDRHNISNSMQFLILASLIALMISHIQSVSNLLDSHIGNTNEGVPQKPS